MPYGIISMKHFLIYLGYGAFCFFALVWTIEPFIYIMSFLFF